MTQSKSIQALNRIEHRLAELYEENATLRRDVEHWKNTSFRIEDGLARVWRAEVERANVALQWATGGIVILVLLLLSPLLNNFWLTLGALIVVPTLGVGAYEKFKINGYKLDNYTAKNGYNN